MEEKKTMGSALLDVFDAGVVLVKSELNGVIKKGSDIAKAKGMGAVLLLGATGPLVMGLIFLILFVFFGLMRLGAGAWFAALLIALFSFVVTAALIFMGLQKLSAEVDTDLPKHPVNLNELPSGAAYVKDLNVTPAPTTAAATPVYESKPSGEAQLYGSSLNEELGRAETSDNHGHHHDPNLQNPVVIKDAPGIAVSTDPTFRQDMKKEGY